MASEETNFVSNSATQALDYYLIAVGPELVHKLSDLDDQVNTDPSIAAVRSSTTLNFVLDFSDAASWVAFDLHPLAIAALLDTDRPTIFNTRWINVFYPSQQGPLLELLGKHYDFSPRLLALMCSDSQQARSSQGSIPRNRDPRRRHSQRPSQYQVTDVERGKDLDELLELSSISSYDSITAGNLYKILNDLWHYSSVDFGRNYVCVGYNSLYGTKNAGVSGGQTLLPDCIRVWTWLVLCEDNTVISIHEDPFPCNDGRINEVQIRILTETRRSLVNVFRSLCNVYPDMANTHATMAQLPIRARLGTTPEETAHRLTDVPGLLFYYLFENWQSSYTLITRRESRYGLELNALRSEMFESPELRHIDRLESIGKELGILKRHYASYNRIIDRLLEPQTPSSASLLNSRLASEGSRTSVDTIRPVVAERESMLGVSLSSAARVRFKRLRDLIDLYALSEVEEYIKQKDSLVAMNFNLIAIKESLDVERLTRLTLLLTKITMIFLPVSLMTAYFSVQLTNVNYTVTQFWTSFTIVLFLSGVTLFIFGLFSGTVQTFEAWRAFRGGLRTAGRWVFGRSGMVIN